MRKKNKSIFLLKLTSYACPEQYDVFLDDEQVGYLRLRNHGFTCYYPDYGKELLLYLGIESDSRFKNEKERKFYLNKAVAAIAKKLKIRNYTYTINDEDYFLY
ncbi:MAG: hypothetical protein ACI4PE_03415 [Bacilli bacterium]